MGKTSFVQRFCHDTFRESFSSTIHLQADLDAPLLGLATGQAMVIYDGDRVVGSATICETFA